SVNSIYFASPGKPQDTSAHGFRVGLADGSMLLAREMTWSAGKASLKLSDGVERPVDATKVVSIEQINGPVSWLSSRQPSENVQTPYFGDEPKPAKMDKTVRGEPIRFGDKTFTHGIGVHSYSRLTFPLDGTYPAFRTRYAIDGDMPLADVTVRIKLDGKTVHEQAGLKAGVLSPVVVVDLNGGNALSLAVDYG